MVNIYSPTCVMIRVTTTSAGADTTAGKPSILSIYLSILISVSIYPISLSIHIDIYIWYVYSHTCVMIRVTTTSAGAETTAPIRPPMAPRNASA